ncbi:hypothetical protein [Silanimonas sp.]|jgi:hypothetical protein|uniref:hypothetical protein n=1 Tax=Silanimonas sp. TaxID=1929290 RepID=UPI0037C80464
MFKKPLAYALCASMMLMSLAPAAHAQNGTEDSPLADVTQPSTKFFPIIELTSSTVAPNKMGVETAKIPFTDEYGHFMEIFVDFNSGAYAISDSSGVIGHGLLTPEGSEALRHTAARLRSPEQITANEKALIIGIAGLILAGAAIYVAYDIYDRNRRDTVSDRQRECGRTWGNMNREAVSRAQQCFSQTRNQNGSVTTCHAPPMFVEEGPLESCQGAQFIGCGARICITTPPHRN